MKICQGTEAWTAIRAAFVKAFELAQEGRWNEIDQIEPLLGVQMLKLKALHVYFPNDILPIYSKIHTRHLLRVLQMGELRPVGSPKVIRVDVRVISATNRVMQHEVAEHRFREDLYHRLAVAILNVPALRERGGDLTMLIGKLMEKINDEAIHQPGYQHKTISAAAKNLLLRHSWPGNVRELTNILQRMAIWSSGSHIEAEDVKDALPMPLQPSATILERPFGEGFAIEEILEEVTRHYLKRAMSEALGNKTKAAHLLGLPSYQTLSNWMKKTGV